MNKLLLKTQTEGIKIGIKSNGIHYSVRDDRSRYFWPHEWVRFMDNIKENKQAIYDTLINTGARIDEALNIIPEDFDWERNNLTLRVTKTKAAKGERTGKRRTFMVSSQYARRMRAYIRTNNIKPGQPLFPMTQQAVYSLMRRTLKKAGFKDWQQFSLHNIRKTHGNYLKALGIPADEICMRLGHDFNTFLRHYGSATIFNQNDKMAMARILGDVYGLR